VSLSQNMNNKSNRRAFIGGSDSRIIMGNDEAALVRLWREKRGEAEPEDLSGNLIVQLGLVTEALNRHWFERNTGQTVECVQHRLRHPVLQWMGATLDGIVAGTRAVFEAKFMLPWSFSDEAAAEKHMAQLQHNMWVINSGLAALSVITGGGKWVEIKIAADSLYQHLLLTAEKKFWRCVESGEPPRLPERGGSIEALNSFLNLPSRNDFVLIIAWLLAALRSRGPYPPLAISGEQGSAKTVLSKLLKALIDPNAAPVRSLSRKERELMIAARQQPSARVR
jgi:predicted phage-related endonuclease